MQCHAQKGSTEIIPLCLATPPDWKNLCIKAGQKLSCPVFVSSCFSYKQTALNITVSTDDPPELLISNLLNVNVS